MNHAIITSSVEKLADIASLTKMFDQDSEIFRMPSEKILAEIIDIVRDIIFPYHYGDTPVYADTLKYYIGVRVDRLSRLIHEQIQIGLEYECNKCKNAAEEADRITERFIGTLPKLREVLGTDDKGKEDVRTVMRFHPMLAPFKCAVLPLSKKLSEKAYEVYQMLSEHFMVDFDDTGSIGKRYRREDEIGTPFCITYDFDTAENDNCVTVRDRDTMEQVRIPITELVAYLTDKIKY